MMDSYVIRIYRRDEQSPQNIIGLVEDVMIQKTKPFKNFNELWEILNKGKEKKHRQGVRASKRKLPPLKKGE